MAQSMSKVLIFTPKHKLLFQKNFDEFIAFAKNKLTLFAENEFNGQKGWNCDKWSWTSARGKKLSIVFGISHSHSRYTPYQNPFADFVKAYVRYHQSLNHIESVMLASSFAWLYQALAEQAEQSNTSIVDIMNINNNVINRTEELINTSDLSLGGKRNIGLSLEKILIFMKKMRFKLDIQDWRNPFPRQSDSTIKLDKKSREKELDKCPSDYQMLQVADAFHRAKTPRLQYFTSLAVMLMCQPSRSIELNGLTIYSLQQSEKGRWFLMWHPAKGGTPIRKWIPKLLEEVVQQAFNRLVEISAPARAAARYAYDFPDRFMIHEACKTPPKFNQDQSLTYDQFANALGFRTGVDSAGRRVGWKHQYTTIWLNKLISELNGVSDWRTIIPNNHTISENNDILRVSKSGRYSLYEPTSITIKFPSYSDLVRQVHKQYKTQDFPHYGGIKIWDCICLVRENEFHKQFKVRPFSWIPVGHGMLADALGSERTSRLDSGITTTVTSIFEELGITDEDGSRLRLTTHQFRHWLNTKLMLSGEEDWLIAKWSGRADIKQNKAYDGRTPAQKSRLTKRIGHVGNSQNVMTLEKAGEMLAPFTTEFPPPPMVLHDLALPVSLTSLGIQREGVAQFTGLGYCLHNYAENPCIKNGDCVTCSEHVCLKGLPHTLEELKSLERLHEEQLAHAKASVDEQVFGADRWLTSLGFKLSKLKTIIAMLEDPKLAEGSQIRVPDELDVSPVKRSIDETEGIKTLNLTMLAMKYLE